jgi:hypothetical protein
MIVNDSFGFLRGEVLLRVLDKNGTCLHRYEDKNAITYMAPLVIKDLLVQATSPQMGVGSSNDHPLFEGWGITQNVASDFSPTNNALRYLQIGTGGATPAVRQQQALVTPVASVVVPTILYPTASSIRCVAQVDANTGNVAAPINEVGLLTKGSAAYSATPDISPAGSKLFARQVHPAVTKTEQVVLEYSWTIYFT